MWQIASRCSNAFTIVLGILVSFSAAASVSSTPWTLVNDTANTSGLTLLTGDLVTLQDSITHRYLCANEIMPISLLHDLTDACVFSILIEPASDTSSLDLQRSVVLRTRAGNSLRLSNGAALVSTAVSHCVRHCCRQQTCRWSNCDHPVVRMVVDFG